MNNRTELLENYESMRIGTDETFKFHCTQCGKCCIHRDDILLSPKDLFHIAQKFQVMPQEIVERYCEAYIGSESHLPCLRLKPQGSVQRCPLLKDRKCMVHDAKPAVCAMFPIGRVFKNESPTKNSASENSFSVEYIFVNPGCGDNTAQHTVQEWLSSFQIPLEDEYFIKWSNLQLSLIQTLKPLENKITPKTFYEICNAVFIGLYLDYDINKDFDSQFRYNTNKITEILNTITTLSKEILK